MNNKLGIIGGGRFGGLVADLADDTNQFSQIVFFDDILPVDGNKIIGKFCDIDRFYQQGTITHLAIAIGYKHFTLREQMYEKFRGKIPFATCIHPTAFVSKSAKIGEGCLIYSMVNIEMHASIANNVTIFNQSSISHEVSVGDHSFFSVGVSMGGGVQFGKRTFVGVNASIANDIEIGDDSIVCGGTFLTKSIGNNSCAIGNPYRLINKVYL